MFRIIFKWEEMGQLELYLNGNQWDNCNYIQMVMNGTIGIVFK